MTPLYAERVVLATGDQVVAARQAVRRWAIDVGFSLVDQTKLVTAASELARNVVVHGGGGHATIEVVSQGERRGLRLTFEDEGPGIADIPQAMTEGFTTSGGLGLGLPGAKRLSNEFSITSVPGQGTRVVITRWK
jgi:serine/threonine-protein kinase RsbT